MEYLYYTSSVYPNLGSCWNRIYTPTNSWQNYAEFSLIFWMVGSDVFPLETIVPAVSFRGGFVVMVELEPIDLQVAPQRQPPEMMPREVPRFGKGKIGTAFWKGESFPQVFFFQHFTFFLIGKSDWIKSHPQIFAFNVSKVSFFCRMKRLEFPGGLKRILEGGPCDIRMASERGSFRGLAGGLSTSNPPVGQIPPTGSVSKNPGIRNPRNGRKKNWFRIYFINGAQIYP